MRGTAILLSATGMISCSGTGDGDVVEERSDSAGVSIVRVAETDRVLDWRFSETWRVGGEEEGPTAFSRLGQGVVFGSAQGSMFVLDYLARRVVEIGGEGDVIRVLGREGEGPGELGIPTSVTVLDDGSVWIYDRSRRGVVRFDSSGAVLPILSVEGYSLASVVRHGEVGIHMLLTEAHGDSLQESIASITEERTQRFPVAILPRPEQVPVPGCGVSIPIGKLFSPSVHWDSRGNRVVTTVGPEYLIDVYDQGSLVMSLRRDTPLVPVTEEIAVRQYPDGFELGLPGGACKAEAVQMVRAQGFAPYLPAVSNVTMSSDGEVWVRRGQVGDDPAPIDVWGQSGEYLGTLPAGTPFPVAFLTDGRIVTVEEDEFDVPQLVVFAIGR